MVNTIEPVKAVRAAMKSVPTAAHHTKKYLNKKGIRAMKNRRLWIFVGVIAVLGAAFLFLDFRVAVSNTQSEKNVTTTGIGDGLPYAMQRRDKIVIAVVGEGSLVSALQKALAVEIQNSGLVEIEFAHELEPAYQNPVLIVQLGKPGLFWTPFFGNSQFSIQGGYASNGDATFMGDTPVTVDNKNGPALNMYGEFKVSDRSWGLISRPGYHHLLADYLARQIVAALKELYKVS
jgi:hypothetical protein